VEEEWRESGKRLEEEGALKEVKSSLNKRKIHGFKPNGNFRTLFLHRPLVFWILSLHLQSIFKTIELWQT